MVAVKRIVSAVVLAACIGTGVFVLGHRGKSDVGAVPPREAGATEAAKPRDPGLEFRMLRLAGSHKGVKQWELNARRVSTNDVTKLAQVEGLESVTVYRDGKPYLSGSADLGTYNLDSKNVEVKGHINLKNGEGDSFGTTRATWDAATETLDMPERIDMTLDGRRITADRARVDVRSEVVVAEGNVSIIGESERIRGSRLSYNLKDESISLEGYTDIDMDIQE